MWVAISSVDAVKADITDPAVVDELCDRISEGRGVIEVCSDLDMPAESTVYRRMAKDEEFARRIARAREAQQDAEPDRIVQMSEDATIEDWQVVKLRIWARQWRASKLAPKKYGDKITQEHTGADGGPIVTQSSSDLATTAAFLLRKGIEAK
jgi:hypothetical protein